jgi:phage terminase large subunit
MKLQITEDYEALINPNHPNYKTRNLVYYGGRGSGKSTGVAQGLLIRLRNEVALALCTREFQNSVSDSVIKTLAFEVQRLGLEDFFEVQTQRIIGKNGSEFIFKGIKNNVNSIKSIPNIKYCWIEEAQTISHNSLEVLIPTVRADGSQLIFTFNPINPTDPVYERYVKMPSDDTYVKFVNFDRNPFLPRELKAELEKLKTQDYEAFEHVYLGKFDNRRIGAVYAKQLQAAHKDGRITKVPYDPRSPVFTAWDLGYGDSTAIWFLQFIGRELRWLDYYENSGEQLDHYAKLINSKPYNYSMAYLPHDGGHGNIRGFSVSQQLTDMGIKNTVLKNSSLESGIEELRKTLAFSVFDAEKCADGLHCLEHYAYEWDEDRKMFKNNPKHDWTSHGADGARYAALAAAIQKGSLTPPKELVLNKRRSWMA